MIRESDNSIAVDSRMDSRVLVSGIIGSEYFDKTETESPRIGKAALAPKPGALAKLSYAPDTDKSLQVADSPKAARKHGRESASIGSTSDVNRRAALESRVDSGGRSAVVKGSRPFITPPSTKEQRIRANGLVNKRHRLGWFKRPAKCQKCGKACKTEGHHEDYMQPGYVVYVCRSCHQFVHRDPEYLRGVVGIDTSFRRDGLPSGTGRIHHKGGRKGPRDGHAYKGRFPLRRILGVESNTDGSFDELLACGHRTTRPTGSSVPKQRRCKSCPRLPAPPPAQGRER